MAAAADAGRAEVDRLLGGLGPLHEFLEVFRRMRRVDDQQQAGRRHLGDRRKVVHRVIRQLGDEGCIHRVLMVGKEQRVAVGRGVLGDLRAIHTRSTAAVIHDGLLAPDLGEMRCEQPGEKIRRAARIRRRDDTDRMTRIIVRSLRGHHRNGQPQGGQQQRQFFKATGNDAHDFLLFLIADSRIPQL